MDSDESSAGRQRVDFFVSHAGRDQVWAEWLAWQPIQAGYTVELDAWDWVPGQDFVARMEEVLTRGPGACRLVRGLLPVDVRRSGAAGDVRPPSAEHEEARAGPRRTGSGPDLYASLIYLDLVGLDEAAATARLRARLAGERPASPPRFPASKREAGGPASRVGQAGRLPALPTVWNVPPRNPHFVGRAEMLCELRTRLRSGEHTLAVGGPRPALTRSARRRANIVGNGRRE